jgi:4'-phosphopantetheinyl transferase
MKLYATKIPDELNADLFEKLLSKLPEERSARIRKFFKKENALQTLFGDIIIQIHLSTFLHCKPQALIFNRNEYGKPLLTNNENIHFNVAHSKSWVAAAIDSSTIGIDIEYIKKNDISIAKRFFCADEYNALLTKKETEQTDLFYRLWTLKESFIKAEGKGLSLPLDSFSFAKSTDTEITMQLTSGDSHNYRFLQYPVDPQFKCAVCFSKSGNEIPDNITIIDHEKASDEFLRLCS